MCILLEKNNELILNYKIQPKETSSICRTCPKILKFNALNQHINTVHKNVILKCFRCHEIIEIEFMENHIRSCKNTFAYKFGSKDGVYVLSLKMSKNSDATLICNLCSRIYQKLESFRKHLFDCHGVIYRFNCWSCQEKCSFKELEDHIDLHSNTNDTWYKFNCQKDKNKKVMPTDLHFKLISTDRGPFIVVNKCDEFEFSRCNICNIEFEFSIAFKKHVENHSYKKYCCKICKEQVSFQDIYNHLHSDGDSLNLIACISEDKLTTIVWSYFIDLAESVMEKCDILYKNKLCVKMKHFENSDSQFYCKHCDIKLSNLIEFQTHLWRAHYMLEMFYCSRCSKCIHYSNFHDHAVAAHSNYRSLVYICKGLSADGKFFICKFKNIDLSKYA